MNSFTPMPGAVTTTARLNIRKGRPSVSAPIATKVDAGVTLAVRGLVTGDKVSGNLQWYVGDNDTYFWSGACGDFRGTPGDGLQPPLAVHRRPNGTIRTLSDQEIRHVFGAFTWDERNGGAIAIQGNWAAQNIVNLPVPALSGTPHGTIRVHTKASGPFDRAFQAVAAAGLGDRIRTCAGTFVPRHKGWNPNRGLSSHSWGIAIDLNVEWNGYGVVPAAIGTVGSLRELVPYFEAEGFAWGGYFEPQNICDGMHFELARLDL